MAKLTLNDIAAGYTSTSTINTNNGLVETAMENTLSRDGTAPNAMSADLDMNSNKIQNLPEPSGEQEPATKSYVDDLVSTSVSGQISGTFNVGTGWDWTAQQDFQAGLRVQDVGGTDSVSFTHDGTDLNVGGVLTTDININDGLGLKIHDSDESDSVRMYHDGNDFYFEGVRAARSYRFRDDAGNPAAISVDTMYLDANLVDPSSIVFGNSGADDSVSLKVTGDSIQFDPGVGVMNTLSLGDGTFPMHLDGTDVSVIRDFTGLQIKEGSDHPITPASTYGQLWVKNDSQSPLVYTTDSGIDNYLSPQFKVKTADETVSSSVTNQDDDHFTGFAVVAPAYYAWEGLFLVDDIGAGGFRGSFAYTIAPTTRAYMWQWVDNAGVSDVDTDVSGVDIEIEALSITAEGRGALRISGLVYFGGSGSGTGKLTWAQETSNASGVTLKQGSWLKLTRIA